jgi:hypothetical protein
LALISVSERLHLRLWSVDPFAALHGSIFLIGVIHEHGPTGMRYPEHMMKIVNQ